MTPTFTNTAVADARQALLLEAPLHPHTDLSVWQETVLFAPHPDDEALGCGGLVSLLRARALPVRVVFVSDGAMSHPNSRKYDRAARVALRRREALEACAELGVNPQRVHFLDYPDTAVPRSGEPTFTAAADRIATLLRAWQPTHLLCPWRRDPHCDHRATWELCRSAVAELSHPPRWVEYPIWMWNSDRPGELPRPGEVIAWKLDVEDHLARKWRAVDRHRSQLTDLIDDDPSGFRLSETMLANFRRPVELYFEDADKQGISLGANYFEDVYAGSDDPWSFESSPYELKKYDHTLDALPRERYANGFEIGCSIGVLTQRLAARCDHLLSVDIADAPLAHARRRLDGQPYDVTFRRMVLPGEFPEESFDLVVVSEVGYYWGQEDLSLAIRRIRRCINPGGTLILVHYTPYVPDYPLTGDEVHHAFEQQLGRAFRLSRRERAARYRLDVYQRNSDAASG